MQNQPRQEIKENVTYIHEWVSINQRFLHFNQFNIIVSQCESVPEDVAVGGLSRLSVAKLADDILNSVDFMPAMCRVDDNVLATSIRWFHHTHDLSTRALLLFPFFDRLGFLIVSIILILLLLLVLLLLISHLARILGKCRRSVILTILPFLVGSYHGGGHVIGVRLVASRGLLVGIG